ncbi:hypothetical protein [Spirillospora sp. CA-294931]|uniref:hypothetical protein n=1 Tax=Spirillospora sp. CA-294931 TaxID=3240042 RepID=UPI003D94D016
MNRTARRLISASVFAPLAVAVAMTVASAPAGADVVPVAGTDVPPVSSLVHDVDQTLDQAVPPEVKDTIDPATDLAKSHAATADGVLASAPNGVTTKRKAARCVAGTGGPLKDLTAVAHTGAGIPDVPVSVPAAQGELPLVGSNLVPCDKIKQLTEGVDVAGAKPGLRKDPVPPLPVELPLVGGAQSGSPVLKSLPKVPVSLPGLPGATLPAQKAQRKAGPEAELNGLLDQAAGSLKNPTAMLAGLPGLPAALPSTPKLPGVPAVG